MPNDARFRDEKAADLDPVLFGQVRNDLRTAINEVRSFHDEVAARDLVVTALLRAGDDEDFDRAIAVKDDVAGTDAVDVVKRWRSHIVEDDEPEVPAPR